MTKNPPDWANSALPMFWVRTFISVPEVAATKAPSFSKYWRAPTSTTSIAPGSIGDSRQSPSPRTASMCCWKNDSPFAKRRMMALPMPPVMRPRKSSAVSIITIASDSQ